MHSTQMKIELVAGFAGQAMATIEQLEQEKSELQAKVDELLEEMQQVVNEFESYKTSNKLSRENRILNSNNDALMAQLKHQVDETKKHTNELKEQATRCDQLKRDAEREQYYADIYAEKLTELGIDLEELKK